MKVIVDTSVLIDHLRGDARALKVLTDLFAAGHEVWSVTVVRVEVLAGMRPKEAVATWALLKSMRWQAATVEVADRAGELARTYLKSHPGVDTVDYVIAATADFLDAQLLTKNVK